MRDGLDRWADPPLLVLASLADEPKHGYAITQDIADTMGVRLQRRHAVRGDLEAGVARPDRAAGVRGPAASRTGSPRPGTASWRSSPSGCSRSPRSRSVGCAPTTAGRAHEHRRSRRGPGEPGALWSGRRWPCTRPRGGPATETRSARCSTIPATAHARRQPGLARGSRVGLAPRQLHDGPARMRSSLATTCIAWALLAGLAARLRATGPGPGLVAGPTLAQHPVIQWSYWVFDGFLVVSVLAVAVGGAAAVAADVPRRPRRRELAWLLAPAVVPVVWLIAAFAIGHLVGRSGWTGRAGTVRVRHQPGQRRGRSLVVPGAGCSRLRRRRPCRRRARAGPAQAQSRGPAVVLAARAAAVAAGTMGLALRGQRRRGRRPVPVGAGLRRVPRDLAARRLPARGAARRAVAVISAARGLRARPPVGPSRPDQAHAGLTSIAATERRPRCG